ncbi:MAG: DNA replication/repair protein RecF [Actinomycetia bacterium]|nr:DNA replication/repair protein RecF [Actinomycetes bacterium]
MQVDRLELTDFRNYRHVELQLGPGLTAVLGRNGEGKSNLIEAVAWLATQSSFRGVPNEALVRAGAEKAIIRADARRGARDLLIEAELVAAGRNRIQINRQRLQRARDLLGYLQVTVFSPDDLSLVKGGPGERRRYVDDLIVARAAKHDLLRTDLDRILRQRNSLLKQSGGRLTAEVEATLMVWNHKLVETGEALATERERLLTELEPGLCAAYDQLAGTPAHVGVRYMAPWRHEGLAAALAVVQKDELRRGVSLVGPHRDEIELRLGDLPARTHASQGEQRSLALALRLAGHRLVTEAITAPPVLLLDDVFSELDPVRADALMAHLPAGQTLLTSAQGLPPGGVAELVFEVEAAPDGSATVRGA